MGVANFRGKFGDKKRSIFWIACIHSTLEHEQDKHGRPHIGANGVSWPPGRIDKKLKSVNMQKRAVSYVYAIFWEQSGQAGVENGAMLTTYLFRCTSECTSQIFKNLFASGDKGALTPLTKILPAVPEESEIRRCR